MMANALQPRLMACFDWLKTCLFDYYPAFDKIYWYMGDIQLVSSTGLSLNDLFQYGFDMIFDDYSKSEEDNGQNNN